MLAFGRRLGQRVIISDRHTGERIVVTVVDIARHGVKVKLGIEASQRFEVDREEIAQRKSERHSPPRSV